MNSEQEKLVSDIFYRAVSETELKHIQQAGKLVLESGELFITQELAWVRRYARTSKAGRYDYLLKITTQAGTVNWLFSIGKRHQGSLSARDEYPFLSPLRRGERNAIHIKVQKGVVTYGLRSGTIEDFNRRIQNITIIEKLI